MVNGIKTIWVWHETPEENWRMHRPKHWEFKNEDEDNIPNMLSDKNHQVSSQKFRQITESLIFR